MERTASAPGKLFLSGEYAVLWGGTARIAAVGARASGYVRRRDDREVHVALEGGRIRGWTTPLGSRWSGEIPEDFRFAARAIDELLKAHGRECLGFELALSPSARSPDGRKPGFGGSARAVLLTAELVRFVLEEIFDPLKIALLVHSIAQAHSGSGGDVAAVFAGEVIRYHRYPVEVLAQASASGQLISALGRAPPVDLQKLVTPPLHLAYAYTGQSVSTPALIAEVERRVPDDGRRRFVSLSDELGDAFEESMLTRDFQTLRRSVAALHELLATLGGLQTDAIHRMVSIARSYGAAGKISGAGRGDGCVLFSPDQETENAMLEGLRARGFWAKHVDVEAGMRGETQPDETLKKWLGPL